MLGRIKNRVRGLLGLEARQRAKLFGDLAPMVPPVQMMFDGPRNLEVFKESGEEFLKIYRDVGSLRPKDRMLDVGFGIGRKTIPLVRYLDERSVYEGLEITKAGVEWCSQHITPRRPNFRFQQIDVYNAMYNKEGRYRASEYRFPFPDDSFDFVMLGSVFTHMLPEDVTNYLSEIHRVMARGSRCMISYFLLNEETRRLKAEGAKNVSDLAKDIIPLDFQFGDGVYRVTDQLVPELAVAYDEEWVRKLYADVGLTIERVDYGLWCGRPQYLSYQDLVLATKRS
jgi:SAM-dependent methyltransferase